MIRIIFLFLPIFTSLFWAITLSGDKKNHSIPRAFLAKFMLFPLFCFSAHFLYFAPLPHIYFYFDVLLQLIGSLILPVFYIYFRLLTVDRKFSFRAHIIYLAIPSIIPVFYAVFVLVTPALEFKLWLYNNAVLPHSPFLHILDVFRKIINIQFLLIVIATFFGSYHLLTKYGTKAEQYYSDINDGKYNNAKLLSLTIFFGCFASFFAIVIGRHFLLPKDGMIYSLWTIFSGTIYLIGYMGMKQKPVNPTFDLEEIPLYTEESSTSQVDPNQTMLMVLAQFNDQKIYLNSKLTIMDLALTIGTNRTYLSSLINLHYGQNFCSVVNNYRIEEVERLIRKKPKYSYEVLAESCGFGSINSFKRSVAAKTGLSVAEWKKQVLYTTSFTNKAG